MDREIEKVEKELMNDIANEKGMSWKKFWKIIELHAISTM